LNHTEHSYFIEEFENMHEIDFQALATSRLEDMADQVESLFNQGNLAEAELLHQEALELAKACDSAYTFLFIKDLKYV
jgi:hypothetical protein